MASAAPDAPADLAALTREQMEAHVGQDFLVALAGGETLALNLHRVTRTIEPGDRPGGGFSLEFTGPMERYFQQGIVPLRFPDGGMAELFIVNNGPRGGSMRYQTIFA